MRGLAHVGHPVGARRRLRPPVTQVWAVRPAEEGMKGGGVNAEAGATSSTGVGTRSWD